MSTGRVSVPGSSGDEPPTSNTGVVPPLAWNRKKPRARTWTLEQLDRDQAYRLYFDPDSFRWEVIADDASEPLVTRVHLNRRSRYDGDRGARTQPAAGGGEASEAPAPSAAGGSTPRHRRTDNAD